MKRNRFTKGLIVLALAAVSGAMGLASAASQYDFHAPTLVKVKPAVAQALIRANSVQKPSLKARGESAAGCLSSAEICIYVNGSGRHVNYVEGFLWPYDGAPYPWCGRGELYINSELASWTNQVCLNPGDSAVSYFPVDQNLPESSIVCVAFDGVSGRPCETVHS